MAFNNQLVKTTLLLDGKEPDQVLKNLSAKSQKLGQDIEDALRAGDTKKLKELYNEYGKVEKQILQVKKASFDVQKVLSNLNGTSLNDLKKSITQLDRDICLHRHYNYCTSVSQSLFSFHFTHYNIPL